MRVTATLMATLLLATATAAMAQDAAPPLAKPLQPIDRAHWITDADYPDLARREGLHGITVYRLDIDANGKVTHCTIIKPSGAPLLDRATCRLLMNRARFIAAQDARGTNIPATYTAPFTWGP